MIEMSPEVASAIGEAVRALQEYCEELAKTVEEIRRKEELFGRPIPPKRTPAAGLSPPQRRYWINYRARDKLPAKPVRTSAIGGK